MTSAWIHDAAVPTLVGVCVHQIVPALGLPRVRGQGRRLVIAGATFVTILVGSGNAVAAKKQTSSLSWVQLPGAEACGGAAAIAKAVDERLGRPALVSPAQADISIEGRAERTSGGFRAVLVVRDATGAAQGTRELESAMTDCAELREKVALAVALMIDPDAVLNAAAQEHAPPPAPPPRVIIERVEVPVAATQPAVARVWRVEPSASIVIGAGYLPAVSVGALVGTTIAPPRLWPVELYGGVWGAQSVTAQGAASVRFASAFGGLGLCPLHVTGTNVSFQGCAAGQIGNVSSEPTGFLTAEGGSLVTAHAVADAHVVFKLVDAVALRAGGSLAAALVRSQFVFDNKAGSQALFDAPFLAAGADLGVAVTLP